MHRPRTPSFRLDGRRALVTGGSRGLGLAAVGLDVSTRRIQLRARPRGEHYSCPGLRQRMRGGQADAAAGARYERSSSVEGKTWRSRRHVATSRYCSTGTGWYQGTSLRVP